MGLNLRFSHLTSTTTPFKHMYSSRNGNKRSYIESNFHLQQMYKSVIIDLRSNSNVFGDREIRLNNKIGKKPF
jgi:hypothetical protein